MEHNTRFRRQKLDAKQLTVWRQQSHRSLDWVPTVVSADLRPMNRPAIQPYQSREEGQRHQWATVITVMLGEVPTKCLTVARDHAVAQNAATRDFKRQI